MNVETKASKNGAEKQTVKRIDKMKFAKLNF
jgi:hypothetical protein